MNKLILSMLAGAFIFSMASCDNESSTKTATAKLNVHLTDAPADYDAVLIDIQDVLIKHAGDSSGWVHLDNIQSGIYDLLSLTGGNDSIIAQSEVDTGVVTEIRLVLGENNSLVMSGDTIPLSTPSAQQSGLKVKINEHLTGGITYKILLDFDASRSVVKAGNSGKYNLKPVIRTVFEPITPQTGSISGEIADSINAVIYAIHDTDSIGTYPDSTGKFVIMSLPQAAYNVAINPEEGWRDTLITNVSVVSGSVTDLGKIELSVLE